MSTSKILVVNQFKEVLFPISGHKDVIVISEKKSLGSSPMQTQKPIQEDAFVYAFYKIMHVSGMWYCN